MNTIGILGGTFNPIHYGHLRLAEELAEDLQMDSIHFIPAANPPHKEAVSISAKHRAAMVDLAIKNNPKFILDSRELHRAGASYTIDTLVSLRSELGNNTSITLLMGSDAFIPFNTWHRWQEILQYCHIALVQRPQANNVMRRMLLPDALETLLQTHYTENSDDLLASAAGYITMRQVTALDISSTAIRDALKHQHSTRYLMPDSVIDYIEKYQLYK